MSRLSTLSHARWAGTADPAVIREAEAAIESGRVLLLADLAFEVSHEDQGLFSPAILSSSKNASLDPVSGRVGGTTLTGDALERLRSVMVRFSAGADLLVRALFPRYRETIHRARASFRPAEIAGRHTSWRKDDTRLHIDSFPANPVQGRRILRVFSNVNPTGQPRIWRIGGSFQPVAERFLPLLSIPWPGSGALWHWLRVTKSRRTAYDALMLQLHDRMKEDAVFQATCEQEAVKFPAGATWIAFTDQVSHAATAGQYQFEQTFLLPVQSMADESLSPLRTLERLTGRRLVS